MRSNLEHWIRTISTDVRAMWIFIFSLLIGLGLWALAIFIWRELYNWFEWVTEPTFLLTFIVIPLPYLAYQSILNQIREHEALEAIRIELARREAEAKAEAATAPTTQTTSDQKEKEKQKREKEKQETSQLINWLTGRRTGWLDWLGNNDPNNGTFVLLIIFFWSLLYWNWPGIDVDANTISVWGLVTIFGLYLIRATLFRKPSKEVSAPETSKR
ncbi:MAG: hypothetical protein ACT4QE_20850 [Anaerolineales bacterium]